MNKVEEVKTTIFFGQYTPKEEPYFDLANLLGVWGSPPTPEVIHLPAFTHPAQGNLFGSA